LFISDSEQLDLVERVPVLAGDHAESVHEVTVEDQDHVVEEHRLERFERGGGLSVRCRGVDHLDELLVRRELPIDCGLGVVEPFLRVVLAAQHGTSPFVVRWRAAVDPGRD
jgi:hypothetical protein